MRKAAVVLTAGALACGIAATTIRFVLVPDAEQVQSTTHTVNHYAGTASFLDVKAAESGDMANAMPQNVPFTATEDFTTKSLSGATALLTDATTTAGPAAAALSDSSVVWSVDRKTLMPVAARAGSNAVDHQGLAVGFPFAPGAHDYPWWDSGTGTAATAKYVRTEQHAGRTALVFTVAVNGSLADKGLLAKLPPSVPPQLLEGLAATMGADKAAILKLALPKNTTDVPLTYASSAKATMWVDQITGTTIDATNEQTVTAQMKSPLGTVPLAAVLDVNTKYTPEGVAEAVKPGQGRRVAPDTGR